MVPCGLGREERRLDALEETLQNWTCDFERSMFAFPTSMVVEANLVRFIRPGLVEEYSVSVDDIRQDFVATEEPAGTGELRLELEAAGAEAERTVHGARLVLEHTDRKLAYSLLHVEDAEGHSLKARIEVTSAYRMTVVVEDVAAVYPVGIDSTFSGENWISINSIP